MSSDELAPSERSAIRFPEGPPARPVVRILIRLALVFLLILASWLLVWLERGDYVDNYDGDVSAVDALYYTTVTLTTTGYGDITPVTTQARLVNALVVTPMRLLFVVLLVGTTIKALTTRSREEFRLARWRRRVNQHVVVLGGGTKGRNAAKALEDKGEASRGVVVVDQSHQAVEAATANGWVGVQGSATNTAILRQAGVERARTVIIALDRDDTAILATLTVRRMSHACSVIASVRESHNAELIKQSGATTVIVTSETAGRLLGLATASPETVEVVNDLLSFGSGLDIDEREVTAAEIGHDVDALGVPVMAVVREGTLLLYHHPDIGTMREHDRIVYAMAVSHEPAPLPGEERGSAERRADQS